MMGRGIPSARAMLGEIPNDGTTAQVFPTSLKDERKTKASFHRRYDLRVAEARDVQLLLDHARL